MFFEKTVGDPAGSRCPRPAPAPPGAPQTFPPRPPPPPRNPHDRPAPVFGAPRLGRRKKKSPSVPRFFWARGGGGLFFPPLRAGKTLGSQVGFCQQKTKKKTTRLWEKNRLGFWKTVGGARRPASFQTWKKKTPAKVLAPSAKLRAVSVPGRRGGPERPQNAWGRNARAPPVKKAVPRSPRSQGPPLPRKPVRRRPGETVWGRVWFRGGPFGAPRAARGAGAPPSRGFPEVGLGAFHVSKELSPPGKGRGPENGPP